MNKVIVAFSSKSEWSTEEQFLFCSADIQSAEKHIKEHFPLYRYMYTVGETVKYTRKDDAPRNLPSLISLTPYDLR